MSTTITAALILGVNTTELFKDSEEYFDYLAMNNISTEGYDWHPPSYDADFSICYLGMILAEEYDNITMSSLITNYEEKVRKFSEDFGTVPRLIVTPIVY